MSKRTVFLLTLAFIIFVSFLIVTINSERKNESREYIQETERAVSKAKDVYKKSLALGLNMDSGPCLTNDLLPGWVVDIVHTPRSEIDELPENQCPAFREGRAVHFVELDQAGNLVRVR